MKEIVEILMRRDGMTRDEAYALLEEVRDMMEDCDYDPEECEDIFESEVGLEPDYLVKFLLG